jgi:DNA-binding PadR family transcriptional regulator
MAATETRLLLLGAVLIFEPANGYQLRRELLSWQVEQWAHINPGSIYSGLATLARQGHLERHDLVDAGREVAVYTSTPAGRAEFERLFGEAVETVDLLQPLGFNTAMTLLPLVRRDALIRMLRARLANADALEAAQAAVEYDPAAMPPHVLVLGDLWQRLGGVERAWVQELLARLERGELELFGEPVTWQASDDDPGWQMARDRERYVRLLAGRR